MAEFDALDGRLRDALAQAANPGDSAGVADAIRSRVAAGDPGTSVVASTAPGWGGGVSSWLPWLGLIVVGAVAGTAVGMSGALGAPIDPAVSPVAVVSEAAPAASCPGGPIVDEFHRGDRLLAVQRSAESDFYGVRDPRDLGTVLWLPAAVLTLDADASALPVGACPEAIVTTPTPTPTPEPEETQAPDPGPQPQPPAPTPDTTAPSIGSIGVQWSNCYFLVTAPVSDDVGVAGVSISWSGVPGGTSRAMTPQGGGVWQLEVSGASNVYGGNYTFTVVATDAAGNTSQRVSSPTNIQCLI